MGSNLLLIPTAIERDKLAPLLDVSAHTNGWSIELCGFGQIAAAARTSQLVATFQPNRVLLVGIAGTLDDRAEVGSAYRFSHVTCHGIGVGSGDNFRSAGEIGWSQFGRIDDEIELDRWGGPSPRLHPGLLSVCAASASQLEAKVRAKRFPKASVEEMEGFGVAMACQLHCVPVEIVRGISNHAGDRDHARWQTDNALQAAATIVHSLLSSN
ncbi:Futalosine hydrolase [Novipirellula galeiformis]|uniref:Futalosine hydrolase n=1 Tax=Novipirellula galeiformis TaxID=2528004 RepID=A0A5C6CGK1_9BACT|nr:futalosine hydrolase [Novipirellula galeiformis]TWU22411.1 Futalosine hydrolase [Novipirellula galeiformis]